jgi:predicted small secreted protein
MENDNETNINEGVVEAPLEQASSSTAATQQLPAEPEAKDPVRASSKSKKRILILGVIIGLLIIACGIGVFYLLTQKDPVSKYAAEVSYVDGQVEKSAIKGTWIEIKNSDTVRQGDSIRVSDGGRAIITLDDGSAIRMSDDSRIRLTSLDPKNIKITNEEGEVYTRVVKADRPFVVGVNDETYRSLGTAYKTVNTETEKGVFVYANNVMNTTKNIQIAEGKKFYKEYDANSSLVNKVLNMSEKEIANDEFVQWNKQQDLKDDTFKKEMGVLETKKTEAGKSKEQEASSPKAETPSSATIILSAYASSSGVNLSWTTSGIDSSKGFKIVKSTSMNPVYPGNSYAYVTSGNSYSWKITDGKTYYFRVCQYTGGGCGVYSNNAQATAPNVASGEVKSITLSGSSKNISWSVDGYSENGFKVVWSKSSGPTYPNRSTDKYHYASSPETKSYTIYAFDGSGVYYVRVCEYLGGSCGIYSNQITVNL